MSLTLYTHKPSFTQSQAAMVSKESNVYTFPIEKTKLQNLTLP